MLLSENDREDDLYEGEGDEEANFARMNASENFQKWNIFSFSSMMV